LAPGLEPTKLRPKARSIPLTTIDSRKAAVVTLRPFCIAAPAAGGCPFLSQLIRNTHATVALTYVVSRTALCTLE
jgi:hypothetical protein